MPRKSKRTPTQNTNEAEVLNRVIDTTGNDPNPVVNALMSEDFIQASNLDASQIALLLQQLVRQNQSLIARVNETSDEIAALRANQARIDEETIKRAASQKREIEEILEAASKHKAKGSEKDKLIAKGVKMYRDEVVKAKAGKTVDRLKFEKQLAAEPKEQVVSPGVLVQRMIGGQPTAQLDPEIIRIKHKTWILQPGVITEVPKSVAQVLKDRRKSQLETAQRAEMLSKHMEAGKLAREWNSVEGSKTNSMPL